MEETDGANFVYLRDREPFARGGKRACYIHPVHSNLCIKLPLPEQMPDDLYRKAPWHRRIRKTVRDFDENQREWETAQWLDQTRGEIVWTRAPRYHGWVETDLGKGLVTEICRDDDELISRSLLDYICNEGYTPEIQQAVDDFEAFWTKHLIPAHNFILNNLVCQKRADGSYYIWVVDGLGSRTLIPASMWFKSFALRDAKNRIAYLRNRIKQTQERIKNGKKPRRSNGFLLSRR